MENHPKLHDSTPKRFQVLTIMQLENQRTQFEEHSLLLFRNSKLLGNDKKRAEIDQEKADPYDAII